MSSQVITGSDIDVYRLFALRRMLGLEIQGLKFRRSVYAQIKREFDLKGNKQRVYDQFSALVEKLALEAKERRKHEDRNPE